MVCECLLGYLLYLLLAIIVVLVFHYVYLLWNSDYWSKIGVFCPNSKALLGNLPGQVHATRNIAYELDDLYQQYKGKHSFIGIYNFRQPRLLVFDPLIIKDILIKYFKHFQANEFTDRVDAKSDPLFGNHSFFLINDEWKTKRSEIAPAFTFSRIKAIYPTIEDVCGKMIKYIHTENEKENFDGFDAKDLAARFTISVVSSSIYAVDAQSFTGGESEIVKKCQVLFVPSKVFHIKQLLSSVYPFLSEYLKVGFCQPETQKFFTELMVDAINRRTEIDVHQNDYLEHLINLRKKKEISDNDIAAHGATFLADGYDTSSSAISFALYELGKNPDVQQKLRDEIMNIVSTDNYANYDQFMDLEYLDQVWNESLRLHPPGYYLHKQCNEAVEIDLPKDKKMFFDNKSVIYIPLMSIHQDPEYYEDPLQFNPDRFSAENGGAKKYKDQGVFFPFGDGPRICVGMRFATAQAKIAIATIVKNFEITVNPKTPEQFIIDPQAIVNAIKGCMLDLKEIETS